MVTSWINIGLVFIAGLYLGLALLIWLRNPKNKINVWFGLFLLNICIWSIAVSFYLFILKSPSSIMVAGTIAYVAGIFVALSFLFFSFYFPFQARKISFGYKATLILIAIALGMMFAIPGFLVKEGVPNFFGNGVNNLVPTGVGIFLYFLSFSFYALYGFRNLLIKYLESSGFVRGQLRYLLYTIFFAFLLTAGFDILATYFFGERFGWVGPYTTLGIVLATIYIAFFSDRISG